MSEQALGWDYPDPYILHEVVRPEDIDGLRHTNNTVYVKWCERVAWLHSVALGLDLEVYESIDRAMAIVRSEFDYLLAREREIPSWRQPGLWTGIAGLP